MGFKHFTFVLNVPFRDGLGLILLWDFSGFLRILVGSYNEETCLMVK